MHIYHNNHQCYMHEDELIQSSLNRFQSGPTGSASADFYHITLLEHPIIKGFIFMAVCIG